MFKFRLALYLAVALSCLALTTFSWQNVLMFLVAYTWYSTVGLSVGFHRFYTHNAFKTSKFWELVMLGTGIVSVCGLPMIYARVHQKHHMYSDDPLNDPHFRYLESSSWLMNDEQFVEDLDTRHFLKWFRKPFQQAAYNWYFGIIAVFVGCLALAGIEYLVWGWALPVVVLRIVRKHVLIKWIHRFGYRNHETGDRSTNSRLICLFTGGEGLHNNHHKFARRWYFGDTWSERVFDLGAWFILLIRRRDVRQKT